MWLVAKIKLQELNIFKSDLSKKLGGNIKLYFPKIMYHKYIKNKLKKYDKLILENYIFCYHEKFNDTNKINEIQNIKGLQYFLKGHDLNQKEIIKFIEFCKSFENDNGYIDASFFKTMISKRAQFVSGPFTNMIFEILEKQKNKLKILIGNIVTTISDNKNYLYRPI